MATALSAIFVYSVFSLQTDCYVSCTFYITLLNVMSPLPFLFVVIVVAMCNKVRHVIILCEILL